MNVHSGYRLQFPFDELRQVVAMGIISDKKLFVGPQTVDHRSGQSASAGQFHEQAGKIAGDMTVFEANMEAFQARVGRHGKHRIPAGSTRHKIANF